MGKDRASKDYQHRIPTNYMHILMQEAVCSLCSEAESKGVEFSVVDTTSDMTRNKHAPFYQAHIK